MWEGYSSQFKISVHKDPNSNKRSATSWSLHLKPCWGSGFRLTLTEGLFHSDDRPTLHSPYMTILKRLFYQNSGIKMIRLMKKRNKSPKYNVPLDSMVGHILYGQNYRDTLHPLLVGVPIDLIYYDDLKKCSCQLSIIIMINVKSIFILSFKAYFSSCVRLGKNRWLIVVKQWLFILWTWQIRQKSRDRTFIHSFIRSFSDLLSPRLQGAGPVPVNRGWRRGTPPPQGTIMISVTLKTRWTIKEAK